LIKCGGTTANNFISTKFDAHKSLDPSSIRNLSLSAKNQLENPTLTQINKINENLAHFRFNGFHFVHGHSPLTNYTSNDFFKFTILRDPISRVISQVKDWKRLRESDIKDLPEENQKFKQFTKENSIYDVIKKWDSTELSRLNLSNMQTRLIFKSFKGLTHEFQNYSRADQIKIALEALHEYDLIGITENFNSTIKELCYKNKWCPPNKLVKLNSNKSIEKINIETKNLIKEINSQDIELYEEALQIHSNQITNHQYSLDFFEKNFAENRTRILTPQYKNNTYLFNFNMPIIASGFHFRDAPNSEECAVWTGPSLESSIFFPVVPECDINILLYIKGYSNINIKDSIKIEIEGAIHPHKFKKCESLDSILVVKYITIKSFVHLKIHIDEVYSSEEDKRLRGISLLKYGFSCNV